jgi:hypothetical protein
VSECPHVLTSKTSMTLKQEGGGALVSAGRGVRMSQEERGVGYGIRWPIIKCVMSFISVKGGTQMYLF